MSFALSFFPEELECPSCLGLNFAPELGNSLSIPIQSVIDSKETGCQICFAILEGIRLILAGPLPVEKTARPLPPIAAGSVQIMQRRTQPLAISVNGLVLDDALSTAKVGPSQGFGPLAEQRNEISLTFELYCGREEPTP